MQGGKLRRTVTIQELIVTQDAFGGPIETWAAYQADVRCSIDPVSGREFIAADTNQAQVVAKITIRYLSGVLPTMRVYTEDAEIYQIEAMLPDPTSRRHILLMCSKGIPATAAVSEVDGGSASVQGPGGIDGGFA